MMQRRWSGIGKHARAGWLVLVATLSAGCVAEGTTVMEVTGVPADLSIVVAEGGPEGAPVEPLVLEVGESVSLAAIATNAIGLAVGSVDGVWSSSAPAVATVTGEGVVTGVAAGAAAITVAAHDLSETVAVEVVEPAAEPTP